MRRARNRHCDDRGFTLLEVLVALVITLAALGVLSGTRGVRLHLGQHVTRVDRSNRPIATGIIW